MPNFNDTNIRILWCAAWNQAATLYSGKAKTISNPIDGAGREDIKNTAEWLFSEMLKPYEPKPEPLPFNPKNDPASEFAGGEWNVPPPKRFDKKV